MSVEYILIICFCCFGIGVCVGMFMPFLFCALYNRMTAAFDFDIYEDDDEEQKQ